MKTHKINKFQTSNSRYAPALIDRVAGESNIFNTDFRNFFSNPEDTQILFYNLKNKLRYISLAKKVKNHTNNFKNFIQESDNKQRKNIKFYSSCAFTLATRTSLVGQRPINAGAQPEILSCASNECGNNNQNFNYTNLNYTTSSNFLADALPVNTIVNTFALKTLATHSSFVGQRPTNTEKETRMANIKKLKTLNISPYGKQLQLSNSEISELNLKNSRSYIGLFGMFNTEVGKNSNIIYNFKKNYKFDNSIYLLYSILKHYFISMRCVISKLYIIKTPYKIKLSLFYYSKPVKINLIIRELLKNIFSRTRSQGVNNNTMDETETIELFGNSDEKIELYKKLYIKLISKYKGKNYRQKNIIRFTPRLIPTIAHSDSDSENNSITSVNSLMDPQHSNNINGATDARINFFPSYPNLNFYSETICAERAPEIINLANTIKNKKKKLNTYFTRNRSRRAAYINRLGNDFNYNKILMNIINKLKLIFKLPIEFELVRLYYPFSNSNIFVNVISYISHKYNIYHICKKAFNLANVKNPTIIRKKNRFSVSRFNVFINPHGLTNHKLLFAFLSGVNIKVAGRLLREPSIPRKTLKVFQIGTLARKKADIVERARVTNKNKRGAFSITIYTGHAFL